MWVFLGLVCLVRWVIVVEGFDYVNVSYILYLELYDVFNDN